MKVFSIIKSLVLSAVAAIILGLLHYQHDPHIINLVEQQVKRIFLTSFNSNLEGSVITVNFFTGTIELENVHVTDTTNQWHWSARSFILCFSWLSFLLQNKFDIEVHLNDLNSHSSYNDSSIAIMNHLQNFISGAQGFPTTLRSLTINNGNFILHNQLSTILYATQFNGTYTNLHGWLKLHINVNNGEITYNTQKYGTALSGQLVLDIPDWKNNIITVDLYTTGTAPHLPSPDQQVIIEGHWTNNNGQLFINAHDKHWHLMFYNWIKTGNMLNGSISSTIPINYITPYIPALHADWLQGSITSHLTVQLAEQTQLSGVLLFNDIRCGTIPLGTMHVGIDYTKQTWKLSADHLFSGFNDMHIEGQYDQDTNTGHLKATNIADIAIHNELIIEKNAALFEVAMEDGIYAGSYALQARNTVTKKIAYNIQGIINGDATACLIKGSGNNKNYTGYFSLHPQFSLTNFMVYEKKEQPLMQITANQNTFNGIIDFSVGQEITNHLFNYKVPGQGMLHIKGTYKDSIIESSLELIEGNIRVPGTYTLIKKVKAEMHANLKARKIILNNCLLELDKGSLYCSRAYILLHNNGTPYYIYAPCLIKKAFLTLQKELFAVFSGNIIYVYDEHKKNNLTGSIIIDRGYFKKNIFAQFNKPITHDLGNVKEQCMIDLFIETKNPIEVKTSFLDTSVQGAVTIQGKLPNPECTGSLQLEKGTFAFPYRPLSITHGTIHFLPHQLYDPLVELVAKGKIRKYQITLRCEGSLQQPTIIFESTPPLTEEQIITLLLAGTEEGSFSLAMPAMIMQTLQTIIFGPEQSATKLEGYFKGLLEQFKHIRFIPGFSDQSGRGGFRGTIEIDVNDQLRGMIQKNFSLSEDIKLEVEYFLSDDITLRGMRDERGDYGGEVEMRWKF